MSDVKRNDASGYNVFLIIYMLSLGYRMFKHFLGGEIKGILSMFWNLGVFMITSIGTFVFIIIHLLLVYAYEKAENTTVWRFLIIMWFLIFLTTNLVMFMIIAIIEKF